jgi:hypothetical protein
MDTSTLCPLCFFVLVVTTVKSGQALPSRHRNSEEFLQISHQHLGSGPTAHLAKGLLLDLTHPFARQ